MISNDTLQKLRPGMQIKVLERILESDKLRLAQFVGVILAIKHGRGPRGTMTVRNSNLAGVGVEKIYPFHSPLIESVDILRVPGRVRRAKLYYLRNVSKKKARQKLGATEVQKEIPESGA